MNKVVKKEDNLPSTELMEEMMATAGEGAVFESNELQIPNIRIAQSTSPQLKKSDAKYIPELKQGDFFNTVTGEVWDGEKGIVVVPCHSQTSYPEFIPESQGGGFVGLREVTDPDLINSKREGAKEYLPNGNEIIKTDEYYCLVLGENGMFQPVIIGMKTTALSVSRVWKTRIALKKVADSKGVMRTPALFATMWRITVVEKSKTVDGAMRTWFSPQVEEEGLVTDPNLFREAKSFRESVAKGEVKAAPEQEASPVTVSDTDVDDIPF